MTRLELLILILIAIAAFISVQREDKQVILPAVYEV